MPLKHYRTALHASRGVLYHLDGQVTPTAKNTAHLRWPWRRHFAGVPTGLADSLVAYLECVSGTRTRSTVLHMASRLGHFAASRRSRCDARLVGAPRLRVHSRQPYRGPSLPNSNSVVA